MISLKESAREFKKKTGHTLLVHENCQREHCVYCDGGLGFCVTCHGAEGTMPMMCPGRPMTEAEEEAVYAGDLEFFRGKWWSPKNDAP